MAWHENPKIVRLLYAVAGLALAMAAKHFGLGEMWSAIGVGIAACAAPAEIALPGVARAQRKASSVRPPAPRASDAPPGAG